MIAGNTIDDGCHFQRYDFSCMLFVEQYSNTFGNSGVVRFSIAPDAIIVEFSKGTSYVYSYRKPGKKHVEAMKHLARSGQGLATYINQHVRENYERRIK